MKITNLKCPSCGGKLEPMENNPKIVVCEYCKSQFMLEEEQAVNYHIHQYATPGDLGANTDRELTSTAKVVWAAICGVVIVVSLVTANVFINRGSAKPAVPVPTQSAGITGGLGSSASDDEEELSRSGASPLYESMVMAIFHKSDAGLVTEEELSRIQYIRVDTGTYTAEVEYSFQDPYSDEAFETVTLTLEPETWSGDNLRFFTGLKKVDLTGGGSVGSLKELTGLKGLVCSNMEIAQVADLVSDPSQLTELGLDGVESLEGIGVFENLESLKVEDILSPDLKQLVPLKHLTCLSIVEDELWDPFGNSDSSGTLTDYSALSVLTGLQYLEIESPAIRDLGFLKPLTELVSLSLSDTDVISVEPLAELTSLTTLELTDNSSVQDYSPIRQLTGLTSLTIDKGTSQDDPDLSVLTGLEKLDMSGFVSISFLKNMGNLKELSIHGCNVDEISALSGLTALEKLTCYSVWTYGVPFENVSFIDQMPNLRVLDFCGISRGKGWGAYQRNTEILGDISNVFNHQGLEELYLNNCMFEINFDRLTDNPSLKKLGMREVSLKENFYVRTSAGMTDLWYDDVALDPNTGFLVHYPNLEELYLEGNQLTNIQFASSLKNLTYLGLNNNYITELSPLNQAESLEYLDVRQNPINGTIEVDDDVVILK